jgi:hypothetical protein
MIALSLIIYLSMSETRVSTKRGLHTGAVPLPEGLAP